MKCCRRILSLYEHERAQHTQLVYKCQLALPPLHIVVLTVTSTSNSLKILIYGHEVALKSLDASRLRLDTAFKTPPPPCVSLQPNWRSHFGGRLPGNHFSYVIFYYGHFVEYVWGWVREQFRNEFKLNLFSFEIKMVKSIDLHKSSHRRLHMDTDTLNVSNWL